MGCSVRYAGAWICATGCSKRNAGVWLYMTGRCERYAVAWLCAMGLLLASATANASSIKNSDEDVTEVGAWFPGAAGAGGVESALGALLTLTVAESGVHAQVITPFALPACRPPEPADGARCLTDTLRALRAGVLGAAVLPVAMPLAPAPWELRAGGLEDMGSLVPAQQRACLATSPPARSLLDLADPGVATLYALLPSFLSNLGSKDDRNGCERSNCSSNIFEPEWCRENKSACATLLTSNTAEALVLSAVVTKHALYARVLPLGVSLQDVLADATSARLPLLLCDFAPSLWLPNHFNGTLLGPPPCSPPDVCPFETRRFVKYANVRKLVRAPSAIRALSRLSLSEVELRGLANRSLSLGPERAARDFLKRHQSRWLGEVRVAVLVPEGTQREAYEARALDAAAALAEARLEAVGVPRLARLKIETYDDRCSSTDAYKYLIDALGTGEYGALSAVAGPVCGAAFADVARQAPALSLPVLAYTSQPRPAGTGPALLAAGDAHDTTAALTALCSMLGWRRLAALSDAGTRPLLETAQLPELIVHTELSNDEPDLDFKKVFDWAERVSKSNGRIVYVTAEDARVVRAALCAGLAAGLTPAAGAVWVLPAALSPGWETPSPRDAHRCTRKQLDDQAEGHLSVAPEWLVAWRTGGGQDVPNWTREWRAQCLERSGAPNEDATLCPGAPSAHAALLFDVLRLWAGALDALLHVQPSAIDDLHDRRIVRSLLENVTATNYSGLTGHFEWRQENGISVRVSPLLLLQRQNGTLREMGRWSRGALTLRPGAMRWRTPDGSIPDDGHARCDLQTLADLLHLDCRTAFLALGVTLLAALAAVLITTAYFCKRRLELRYRKRLFALDMQTFASKTVGLDRWELPRERVVINRKLGMGAFGVVYGGHALLAEDRGWSAVAVKTLKGGATTEEKLDFLSEAEAMKRFDHKNIVRLLGVVTKTEPVCTVMELMLYGDLKTYLLARRHLAMGKSDGGEDGEEVSPRRLTAMALDAARALSYLAQLRYVHRDVAARNCLVAANRQIKLADFGMTRLVFENDYYRFSRKGMLPVRWMAPESLALGVFSPASDIWSFGVLLYEIVTFGALPYQGLGNAEVLTQVKAGRTLELPAGLKPRLEGLIKSCWQQEARARPAAAAVVAFLADSPRLLTPTLDSPVPMHADFLDLHTDAAPPDLVALSTPTSNQARWVSWAAPPSAATDTTYLSTDADVEDEDERTLPQAQGDLETDAFLQ